MTGLIDFYISPPSILAERVGNSCFVYAPLPADPLESMRNQILEQIDVEVDKIYDPDKFHITLLYIEDCGLSEIERLVDKFMPPIQFEVELASLEILGDDPTTPPLVWRINPDPALLRLQSDLYFRAANQSLPISPFSKPEVYKPHVTVAYLKGIPRDVPSIVPFKLPVDRFKVGRDDYETLFTVHLPTGRGEKLFVETHSESNGHTEITQSELKSILSGERVVYGPQRRILGLLDGPFSLRHGKHSGQAGVEGQQGGSAPGFTHNGADADEGADSVESHSEGPDSFDNLAGDFATTTLDRDNPDVLVKLIKFTPEVDEEGNADLEAVGTWEVEIMTGPNNGYIQDVSDYDLDSAPMGTADTWTTDTSPSATLERAEGIFGTTDFMSEAGFIMPDGKLLDFSGGPGGEGMRGTDHRSISQALLDDQGGEAAEEYSGGLIYFMDHTGAVRVNYSGGRGQGVSFSLDVSRQPTSAQWGAIREWAGAVDDVNIDISDPGSGSVLWSNSNPSDIDGSLRELREHASELLEGARVLRMVIRHGTHVGQEGVEGEQGGSAEGFTHGDAGGKESGKTNTKRKNSGFGAKKKPFGKPHHVPFESIDTIVDKEDFDELRGDINEWPTEAGGIVDAAIGETALREMTGAAENPELLEQFRNRMDEENLNDQIDSMYQDPLSFLDLDVPPEELVSMSNSEIEASMRELASQRIQPTTNQEALGAIEQQIREEGPTGAGAIGNYSFARDSTGDIVALSNSKLIGNHGGIEEMVIADFIDKGFDESEIENEILDAEWTQVRWLASKDQGKGYGSQLMAKEFIEASDNGTGLVLTYLPSAKTFYEQFDPIINDFKDQVIWTPNQVEQWATEAREVEISTERTVWTEREHLDELLSNIAGEETELDEPTTGALAHPGNLSTLHRGWLRKFRRENPEFISPGDQAVFDARKKGERKQRGVEEDQLLADVLGKRTIQNEVAGLFTRLAAIFRHGKHEGQEGVEGQQGGSSPGFTHTGANSAKRISDSAQRVSKLADRARAAGIDVAVAKDEWIETQSRMIIQERGEHDLENGGREGFVERWEEIYKNTEEADPEFTEYVLEGIIAAKEQGLIPEDVGVVIRKSNPDKPSEEFASARWNGYILVIQNTLEQREGGVERVIKLHEDESGDISDIGSTDRSSSGVAGLYDHYWTGVAVHEYGHNEEDRLTREHLKAGTQSPTTRAQMIINTEPERAEKWLGSYSVGAAHEMFAEAYAMAKHPSFDKAPDETRALVEEIFGDYTP